MSKTIVFLTCFTITLIATQPVAQGQYDEDFEELPENTEQIRPAEDPKAPRRHFRVRDPAQLTESEVERIYAQLKQQMAKRYRLSNYSGVASYQMWQRHNRVPFRSAAHGQRFVNIYANEIASAYGKFEKAGTLPIGSIIAKDSVDVTDDGSIQPGPLFLMEKRTSGFNAVSGDWRYAMITPDGRLFGETKGIGSDRVKFCISCHLVAEDHDHLRFMPHQYRR